MLKSFDALMNQLVRLILAILGVKVRQIISEKSASEVESLVKHVKLWLKVKLWKV